MDFDQTQAIDDFEEEEEEEKVEEDKASSKKNEAAHLKVFSQQGFKETTFPIFKGDNFIGRDGKCNITVPIKALSKKHACIEVQRDLHLLYDCGSKNRTRKGKSFLKPMIRYELKHGDMLTLGDVTCQYLVDLDDEEEDGDETGSETGSESMLIDVNADEGPKIDKPIVSEGACSSNTTDEKGAILRESLLQPTPDHKITKPTKDDEEAYAADTDSDTDEERPVAPAAVATILYSSEDEHEIPNKQKAASVPIKENTSMDGQTLAFGLGSPGNVFRSRDSTGSSGSYPGQTGSIPPTMRLSTESDSQSDGKEDDNQASSFRHPGARGSGIQPPCEPTLLYGSESEDGSPMKRPRHPVARVSDKGLSCEPTLLYGSESDESPKNKPRQAAALNEPPLFCESDSEEGNDTAAKAPDAGGVSHQGSHDQTLLYSDVSEGKLPSLPGKSSQDVEERQNNKQEVAAVKDNDATLPYCTAEMSSTDDEGDSDADGKDKKTSVDETPAPAEPTVAYNTEEMGKEDSTDDEHHNADDDDYGADIATQAYAVESDSETGSESIPVGNELKALESDANKPAKPSDLEATQAYCIKEEEEESDSSDSQPLPIGTAITATNDDILATLAYGVEEPQALSTTEKDGSHDNDGGEGTRGQAATLAYDLQATQAYGIGASDDEEENSREGHPETGEEQPPDLKAAVSGSDAVQPTIAYGLEATQAYGADETDDEETDNEDKSSMGGDQVVGHDANAATLAYDFAPTQPYDGDNDNDDDDDESEGDNKDSDVAEHIAKQENLATLAYGLEETQAYADGNNDTDSAQNSMVEATQAYGIDDPSTEETEQQAQQSDKPAEKTNNKKVAFVSSSAEVAEVDETEIEVSVTKKVDKSKPSTSTAADVQDDQQEDSEDLIQPRSRSKRGRKKPVIEESLEEASQQLGMSGNQAEPVVASSSGDTREQTEVESEAPRSILKRNDKTPPTTPSTRKGRRGAMRVTIEPEEPAEDEGRETSSRRGRKGAKVTKESENQEVDIPKGAAATTGRKRGRQTGKEQHVEEVEETPVRKSRRGQRGKAVQAEATSVSEMPLKTSTDTAAEAGAPEPETASAANVEPFNVRRGGRGRGRKGPTPKESAQATEAQDAEVSGVAVELQPDSSAEAVPTRGKGKGKGKGRGRKSEPSMEELVTTESIETAVSTISDDTHPLEAVTPPARGKGRGRGRGKKAQQKIGIDHELEVPASTSPHSVPETPTVVNDDDPQPSESPAMTTTAKGKGRGRQGKGKRLQPTAAELEALALSEGTEHSETIGDSEESSTAGSSKQSSKGRQRKQQEEDSESVEVEETPAKRGRRGKEPAVNRSPSLQRGKSSTESSPRIMFTGLVDKQGEKVVTSLGGQLVDNIHSCTHLVTDKVRRTVKFLCGLAGGQVIVLPLWLDACKKAKSFVDTSPFLVKDKDAEKQYKFDLQRSHELALTKGLLEGYKVHVTKKVKPEPSQMKDIIQSAKGEFLTSMPRNKDGRVLIISCEDDRSVCKKPLEAGIPVVSAEVLLTGVLRQELNLEEYKLFTDEVSDTSQDTSSSSRQNKRRKETSEADASSSSTTETKSTGSKRRKR